VLLEGNAQPYAAPYAALYAGNIGEPYSPMDKLLKRDVGLVQKCYMSVELNYQVDGKWMVDA
jgi:hypothetical protein